MIKFINNQRNANLLPLHLLHPITLSTTSKPTDWQKKLKSVTTLTLGMIGT